MQDRYKVLEQKISETSLEGFKVGHRRPSCSYALFEGALKISNRQQVMRAYFNIKTYEDQHVVMARLDLNTGTNPEECLPHPDDKIKAETVTIAELFRVNPVSGLVELQVKLVDPKQWALWLLSVRTIWIAMNLSAIFLQTTISTNHFTLNCSQIRFSDTWTSCRKSFHKREWRRH